MIRYSTLPSGEKITQKTLKAAIVADATTHESSDVRTAVKDWVKKAQYRTIQLLKAGDYIDAKKWQRLSAAERALIAKPIDLDWSVVS